MKNFISSFLIWIPFISFFSYCSIANIVWCWIAVVRDEILAIFPLLVNHPVSQLNMLAVYFIFLKIKVRIFRSILSLLRVLILDCCWILWNTFFHLLMLSHDFPFVCWYGRLHWFSSIEPSLYTWNKSHWSWCIRLIYIGGFYLLILSWGFYSLFMKDTDVLFSILVICLSNFVIRIILPSLKDLRSFPLFLFSGSDC